MSHRLSHTPSFRTTLALLMAGGALSAAHADTPNPPASGTESPEIEVGVQRVDQDTQGVAGLTIEQADSAWRLTGDHSRHSQHLLLGGGTRLGGQHHLIGGLSVGREPIPGREERMKGYSALLRLSGAQPVPGIRLWFVEGLHQRTNNRLLSVTDTPFDETTTVTEGGSTSLVRSQGIDRDTLRFYGGRRTELAATVEARLGAQGVLGLRWLQGRTRLLDTRTSYRRLNLNVRHYLPEQDAQWVVDVDNKGRWQFGGEIRLARLDASLVLQAYKNTRDTKTEGIYLGLRFELGDVPTHPGRQPEDNVALLRDTVRAMYAPRNYFGTVLNTRERLLTAQTSTPQPAPRSAPARQVDPAPTDITLQQTAVLTLEERGQPVTMSLVLSTATPAGSLSCTDVGLAPHRDNTCTFSGGNGLIRVASDGSVSFGPGTYGESSFTITVTATDQAGNTYTRTLTLKFDIVRP